MSEFRLVCHRVSFLVLFAWSWCRLFSMSYALVCDCIDWLLQATSESDDLKNESRLSMLLLLLLFAVVFMLISFKSTRESDMASLELNWSIWGTAGAKYSWSLLFSFCNMRSFFSVLPRLWLSVWFWSIRLLVWATNFSTL